MEGQRLGLTVHAHDLNPVAVLINKAMIEIPPKFAGHAPVHPRHTLTDQWLRAEGLAEDVAYYGQWMKEKAYERIGHLYPEVTVPSELGGGKATVIAWIWARTVTCPNPACHRVMPLASSFVLSKKKGKEAWAEPYYDEDDQLQFRVHQGACPKEKQTVKMGKGGMFRCVNCGTVTTKEYIHDEFISHRNGAKLMAIVAEGPGGRLYLSPDAEQEQVARSAVPEWAPEEDMNTKSSDLVSGRGYGITQWKELFSNRQLTALTTFSDLVKEAQAEAEKDAVAAGMADDGIPLDKGGTGARAYGEAVSVYLAFAVDRQANYSSTLNVWGGDFIVQTFGRQALPMVWDYAESNLFSTSTGCWKNNIQWVVDSLKNLPSQGIGIVNQADAQDDCGLRNIMVSTDPPYYDYIGYADLSDYFYIWMRKSLRKVYSSLFRVMLVPKENELVALSYRFQGDKKKAKAFFEEGMFHTCKQIYKYAKDEIPVTIYYSYKQEKNGSGWETMLSAIIRSGFMITGTWPMRTERATGLKASVNALASSVVLVCRKRDENAGICTRKEFMRALMTKLPEDLRTLQNKNIAPVDLAQSAIGPGMRIFSQYQVVLESDGTPMTVGAALSLINHEVELYFSDQDTSLDPESRFCVALYSQYGWDEMRYGDADNLARAKNTSVETMRDEGILYAKGGVVRLLSRDELLSEDKSVSRSIWEAAQRLTAALERGGVEACAQKAAPMMDSQSEYARALVYRLHQLAEKKNWTGEAYAYNALITSWPDVTERRSELKKVMDSGNLFANME